MERSTLYIPYLVGKGEAASTGLGRLGGEGQGNLWRVGEYKKSAFACIGKNKNDWSMMRIAWAS